MSFDFRWTQDGVDYMRELHKNRWHTAANGVGDVSQDEATEEVKIFPVVQQMKGDLRVLREETFPELTREVAGLKQATRAILELLRPPELLDLQGGTATK